MKRNTIVKRMVCAVVAFAAMCGRADMPRPSYSYHAMPYPTWLLNKTKSGHGHVAILVIVCIVVSIAIFCMSVHVRRKIRMMARKASVVGSLPSDGNEDRPSARPDFAVPDFFTWGILVILAGSGLLVVWISFGNRIIEELIGTDNHSDVVTSRDVDITVEPKPGESYEEYLKRVRQYNQPPEPRFPPRKRCPICGGEDHPFSCSPFRNSAEDL